MKTGSDKGVGLRAQEGWEGREECEGGGGLRAGVCGQGKGPGGQLRAQSLQLCTYRWAPRAIPMWLPRDPVH